MNTAADSASEMSPEVRATESDGGGPRPTIKLNVWYGSSHHEVHLPAQSTFGDVKKLLVNKTGLEPEQQRLFFRGIEKGDNQHLHLEGVKDKSKIFLLEGTASKERKAEQTRKQNEMSKAFEAIAGVRAEVDKLSNRVTAIEVSMNAGNKASGKEFLVLTELLMSQLLKLDSIDAEGEAKLQRKAETAVVDLSPLRIRGLVLNQPMFGGEKRTGSELKFATDQVLPLPVLDLLWSLALPKETDRDHRYCNPMVKGPHLDNVKKVVKCLVLGYNGDIMVDRQQEFVTMLVKCGVQVEAHFDQVGFHNIDMVDAARASEIIHIAKDFILG